MRIPVGSRDWPDWNGLDDRHFDCMPDLLAWRDSPPSPHDFGMFCEDVGYAESPSDIFYASLPYLIDVFEPLPAGEQIKYVTEIAGRYIGALEYHDGQPKNLSTQIHESIPRMNSILSNILVNYRIMNHDQMIGFLAIIAATAAHFPLCNRLTEIGIDDL